MPPQLSLLCEVLLFHKSSLVQCDEVDEVVRELPAVFAIGIWYRRNIVGWIILSFRTLVVTLLILALVDLREHVKEVSL